MSDEPLKALEEFLARAEARDIEDAARFSSHDQSVCMLCGAKGEDKRSLWIDCFYAVHEVPDDQKVAHNRGYYLRICKTCRGRLLEHLRTWGNECRTMRELPKDSDGSPEFTDPDRNIPVRMHGTTVVLTREEWDRLQREKNHGDNG